MASPSPLNLTFNVVCAMGKEVRFHPCILHPHMSAPKGTSQNHSLPEEQKREKVHYRQESRSQILQCHLRRRFPTRVYLTLEGIIEI